MKKLKGALTLFLSLAIMFGTCACSRGNDTYEAYYTFDVSAIESELLYGKEMKIDPVIKNLGEVVQANYSVKITFNGQDVTADVYNAQTKMFAPGANADKVGLYTFTLAIVDGEGNEVKDSAGNAFVTSFNVDYCIMNFIPKAGAGADVTVDTTEPLKPIINFGETYSTDGEHDSGQYRVTGVTFKGDYEIVYNIKVDAIGSNVTRLYFGIDRTDENKRDDNIALNVNDGTLSAWFFPDNGTAGGSDWTGSGWINTGKSVSDYASLADGSTHKLGFRRVIEKGENANAYYVITWNGEYFTSLNIKGNYTDVLGAVWVESLNTQGSISIDSYYTLEDDTKNPVLALSYEEVGINSTVDLMEGLTITDENYNAYSSVVWNVTDPSGDTVTVSGGKMTVTKNGEYIVKVTVKDLKGNTAEAQTTVSVISDFSITGLNLSTFCKAGSEITVGANFTSDDEQMINSAQLTIQKDGVNTETEIRGNATSGFKFTLNESGVYTAVMKVKSGIKDITKSVEFTVSGSNAVDIDLSKNTATARNHALFLLYADSSADVQLSIVKGDSLSAAQDVTADVIKSHTTKTLDVNKEYKYFAPNGTGTYYLKATAGNGDTQSLKAFKITVSDKVSDVWAYDDEKLDMGNGNLDKIIYGNNEVIFMDNGVTTYSTSKMVYDNLGIIGDFDIEFSVTDLEFKANNKKLFITLGMYDAGNEWQWSDITLEGSPNNDLWGYCTNIFGAGWIEYQWRSVWQNVTKEFIPDNDANYEGEPFTQYAFRDGKEYAQYGTGTHTYRIEVRQTNDVYTVYYYIDGRPEATHRNLSARYNTLGCVVIWSDSMAGVLSNISVSEAI